MDIARDVAKKLLEAQAERQEDLNLPPVGDSVDFSLVVGL
jgi:hypothetical protein